jgi:hypothetical protein
MPTVDNMGNLIDSVDMYVILASPFASSQGWLPFVTLFHPSDEHRKLKALFGFRSDGGSGDNTVMYLS